MDRLFSKLFADDRRLQDCLVKDSAHVTRECRGDYVGKIQYALLVVQGGKISGRELEERLYGPDTANLVLAYKTRLGIINRSYQTKPDDIVGKMTIFTLDKDFAAFEIGEQTSKVLHA